MNFIYEFKVFMFLLVLHQVKDLHLIYSVSMVSQLEDVKDGMLEAFMIEVEVMKT